MRIASDVGGTFTDLVYLDTDETGKILGIKIAKSDTTPPNFEEGVFNTIAEAKIDISKATFFAHGTTVVINAITERKGVKTAFITTKGFRDSLEKENSTHVKLNTENYYIIKKNENAIVIS